MVRADGPGVDEPEVSNAVVNNVIRLNAHTKRKRKTHSSAHGSVARHRNDNDDIDVTSPSFIVVRRVRGRFSSPRYDRRLIMTTKRVRSTARDVRRWARIVA